MSTSHGPGARPAFHSVPSIAVTRSKADLFSNSTKTVQVMVQLSGQPVTVADAKSSLTAGQKSALRNSLVAAQNVVGKSVRSDGGTVLGSYQYVYNGLRVNIAANKVAQLAKLPGVIGVHAFTPKTFDNIHGVPLIGAPQVWQGVTGSSGPIQGDNIKIGIIDTGIDYTHADFGGPGTVAAYQAALATDTAPADPSLFGPSAPRVKGGTDLVGDAYDGADPTSIPQPDPNPLDCNSHGTHVAGTAAGSGVLSDGSTYTGPYQSDTVSSHTWNVGPGVAPKADIYSIRVFGCSGSTNVVVDAIEWAVANHMDVINMSLGSPFGGPSDPDAVAVNNAAKDGTIVVSSAGNNGQLPYMEGTPGSATAGIAVAASDPTQAYPGATVTLSTSPGSPISAIDANGISVAGLGTLPVKVLFSSPGVVSLGCNPAEYNVPGVPGALVVVKRGTCARVDRAIYGQQAGAAAVLMINSDGTLPPFEGPITQNPDTGVPFNVTIPFLGSTINASSALVAADGGTVNLADATISNPGYLVPAGFTSGGPRSGDSRLKPDVTAPGVSIISAGMGTGDGSLVDSGTSMAAPHTTGEAALVREAHPSWKLVKYWKAAIVNTASADLVNGYSVRIAGSGLIQAPPAVATNTVAIGDQETASLSYGYANLLSDFSATHKVTLRNFGATPVTFDISHRSDSGSPHSLGLPASVTVPAHGSAQLPVALTVPAATAGDSSAFRDVAGLVTFTPRSGGNNGVALAVPYYMVPQTASQISVKAATKKIATTPVTATIANTNGATTGAADWYAWGLSDPKDAGLGADDVKAVGVQAFPGILAFAIGTWNRWSNGASLDNEIGIDADNNGSVDYVVVAADLGLLQSGVANGQDAVAVFNNYTGAGSIQFLADAPTDSTTMVLPVNLSQLCTGGGAPCVDASNPRFTYTATSFGPDGTSDQVTGSAKFNAVSPAVSTGMFDVLAPNASTTETLTEDPAEQALTPALGFMVVSHDNKAGTETKLISIP